MDDLIFHTDLAFRRSEATALRLHVFSAARGENLDAPPDQGCKRNRVALRKIWANALTLTVLRSYDTGPMPK